MTTASELHQRTRAVGEGWQREINQFVDDFRRAPVAAKRELVRDPIVGSDKIGGLIAAVVSSLCRDAHLETPSWAGELGSPEPFFVLPARSFEMRLRLMLESPAPFRVRNVFVPESYLSRA